MKKIGNGAWVEWYGLWQAGVLGEKTVPAFFVHCNATRIVLGS
jgi:hypothetical protein